MAEQSRRSNGELTVMVNVDVSDALTGLKAIRREADAAVRALKALEEALKTVPDVYSGSTGGGRMTPEQFVEKMREIFPETGYDEETAYIAADNLVCELLTQLGYGEGAAIYDDADKWYA
ncbi:hypothetical protein ACQKK5_07925 [Brevibacillus panacihumi]|uniref:hypothetical protein n=1 Tax=Brevibacillus panacihumi TaxID=497735 RepID=UPI003D00B0D9